LVRGSNLGQPLYSARNKGSGQLTPKNQPPSRLQPKSSQGLLILQCTIEPEFRSVN